MFAKTERCDGKWCHVLFCVDLFQCPCLELYSHLFPGTIANVLTTFFCQLFVKCMTLPCRCCCCSGKVTVSGYGKNLEFNSAITQWQHSHTHTPTIARIHMPSISASVCVTAFTVNVRFFTPEREQRRKGAATPTKKTLRLCIHTYVYTYKVVYPPIIQSPPIFGHHMIGNHVAKIITMWTFSASWQCCCTWFVVVLVLSSGLPLCVAHSRLFGGISNF